MAARKKFTDPIVELENQIAQLTLQLEKARTTRLNNAERSVAKAVKTKASADKKLSAARAKLKIAQSNLKAKKTAAAQTRLDNTKALVAEQMASVASAKASLTELKENLRTLSAAHKLNLAIEKAISKARSQVIKASTQKPRSRPTKKVVTNKTVPGKTSSVVMPTTTPPIEVLERPSLFGED